MKTEDFYADLASMRDLYFDTSNFPKEHPLYSSVNKSVPGFFKDEVAGCFIFSWVGLRSKVNQHTVTIYFKNLITFSLRAYFKVLLGQTLLNNL